MTCAPLAPALLEVLDLSVAFRRHDRFGHTTRIPVLHKVSLDIHRGEVLAVVGSSGAGKSILAHAILGLLPRNAEVSHTMRFCGEPLDRRAQARLCGQKIALVPQAASFLDPLVTARHAVRWAARRAGLSAVEAVLAQKRAFLDVGFPEEAGDRYPHQLSGGMVRRLLLAIAAVGHATLLIADEPTPGLDPTAVEESLGRLRRQADGGRGVLLITHDLRAGLRIADRVAVFLDGRVVEVTTAAAFSGEGANLGHPYSRALWNALPDNAFEIPDDTGIFRCGARRHSESARRGAGAGPAEPIEGRHARRT